MNSQSYCYDEAKLADLRNPFFWSSAAREIDNFLKQKSMPVDWVSLRKVSAVIDFFIAQLRAVKNLFNFSGSQIDYTLYKLFFMVAGEFNARLDGYTFAEISNPEKIESLFKQALAVASRLKTGELLEEDKDFCLIFSKKLQSIGPFGVIKR